MNYKIIPYNEKYKEAVGSLLIKLEKYVRSIGSRTLDQLGREYEETMALYNLERLALNNGKCFIAVSDDKVIGLVMGLVNSNRFYDLRSPTKGEITELLVTKEARANKVDVALIEAIESYLKNKGCFYVNISLFGYNNYDFNPYNKFLFA